MFTGGARTTMRGSSACLTSLPSSTGMGIRVGDTGPTNGPTPRPIQTPSPGQEHHGVFRRELTLLRDTGELGVHRDRVYDTVRNSVATSDQQHDVEVIAAPPQSPPLLMLEGDEFYVSPDGVARTYYRLVESSLAMEEFWNLKSARKKYILRKNSGLSSSSHVDDVARDTAGKQDYVLGKNEEGVVRLGGVLTSFELQEIDQGVFGSAGTGSTTWESSILMGLFFNSNPHLLHGDVLELGSGVGLGGILCQIARRHTPTEWRSSMTLTDCNPEVLEECDKNMQRFWPDGGAFHISNLNWHDFVDSEARPKSSGDFCGKYDTVIASDCAYLYPDVVALSHTMVALLSPTDQSRIHIFGPYNRGPLHELIVQLKERNMKAVVDEIEMDRYRLKPPRKPDGFMKGVFDMATSNECTYASKNLPRFLHITAWHDKTVHVSTSTATEDID